MYLVGGIVSVILLWTFVTTFVFTKEEIETIINYTLSRKQITKLPTVNIDLVNEISSPLANTIFNQMTDFSYIDKNNFSATSPQNPSQNKTKNATIVLKKINIQPLQRNKIRRQSSYSKRDNKDINYLKQATTRKIIDKVQVFGIRKVIGKNEKQIENAYLLQCTTKASSFISIQTLKSIQSLQKTMNDRYSVSIPPLSFAPNGDIQELNTYFSNILCHKFLRDANELVNPLYQSRFVSV